MPTSEETGYDGPKPKLDISGARPPAAANGLLGIVADLIANPGARRVAVVEFDTQTVKIVTDTGQMVPCVRFRQIEPIADPESVDVLSAMLRRAMEARGVYEQPTLDEALDPPGDAVPPEGGRPLASVPDAGGEQA